MYRKLVFGAFAAVSSGLPVSRVIVMLRNGTSVRTSHFLDEQREPQRTTHLFSFSAATTAAAEHTGRARHSTLRKPGFNPYRACLSTARAWDHSADFNDETLKNATKARIEAMLGCVLVYVA
jgi:hypothetical protein